MTKYEAEIQEIPYDVSDWGGRRVEPLDLDRVDEKIAAPEPNWFLALKKEAERLQAERLDLEPP